MINSHLSSSVTDASHFPQQDAYVHEKCSNGTRYVMQLTLGDLRYLSPSCGSSKIFFSQSGLLVDKLKDHGNLNKIDKNTTHTQYIIYIYIKHITFDQNTIKYPIRA